MARTPYTQLDYSGTATIQTMTTSGGISSSATTFNISSSSTWINTSGYYLGSGPTNVAGSAPFVVAIDYNTTSEEKVLCSGVTSGGVVTIITRGYDGTTAVAHNSTIINCVPVFSATEAKEANAAVANTVGQIAAAGDILVGTAANAMDNLAIGAQGTNLSTNGTTASWQPGFPYSMGAQGSILTTNGTTPGWTAKGAQGSVPYAGATGIAFTAAGTSGQFLASAGTGTPTWVTAANIGYYTTSGTFTASSTAATVVTTSAIPFSSVLVTCVFTCTGTGTAGTNVNVYYSGTGLTNNGAHIVGYPVAGYNYADTRIMALTSGNTISLQLSGQGSPVFNNFQVTVLGIS